MVKGNLLPKGTIVYYDKSNKIIYWADKFPPFNYNGNNPYMSLHYWAMADGEDGIIPRYRGNITRELWDAYLTTGIHVDRSERPDYGRMMVDITRRQKKKTGNVAMGGINDAPLRYSQGTVYAYWAGRPASYVASGILR